MRVGAWLVLALLLGLLGSASAQDSVAEVKKDIIAKQALVNSLSADVKHVINMVEPGEFEMASTDEGRVEFMREGNKTFYRSESTTSGFMKEGKKKEKTNGKVLLVCDGDTLFMEMTHGKKRGVEKYKPSKDNLPLSFLDAATVFAEDDTPLRLLPEEAVSGRTAYVFQTITHPDAGNADSMKLYFDKETGVLMKSDMIDSTGKHVNTREFTNIKVNEKIDESRFKYTPPKGVKVIDETQDTEKTACGVGAGKAGGGR